MRTRIPCLVCMILAVSCSDPQAAPSVPPAVPVVAPPPVVVPPPTPPAEPAVPAPGAVIGENERDACLLGTWRLLPANALAFYRGLLATLPMSIDSVGGVIVMTLEANGSASSQFQDFTVTYRQNTGPSGPTMNGTIAVSGGGRSTFRARGGQIVFEQPTFTVTGNATIAVGGRSVRVPMDNLSSAFTGSLDGYATYVCEPGQLKMRYQAAPNATTVWVR